MTVSACVRGDAGKTYIGIKLVQAILANTHSSREHLQRAARPAEAGVPHEGRVSQTGPEVGAILVICFTNHALDQFLEGLVRSGIKQGLVRVGGVGKSEMLKVS